MNPSPLCPVLLALVEAVAAGEVSPDAQMAAHFASCPVCGPTLERARNIERLLRAGPVPAAPPHFTTRTLARVRHERWRRDQLLDFVFNSMVIMVVSAAIVGLLWIPFGSGLVSVTDDAARLVEASMVSVAAQMAPAVPLYAGAAALLAGAVGLWWWAERGYAR